MLILLAMLTACTPQEPVPQMRSVMPTVYDVDQVDDPLATGHLLMRAGQYELALRAFTRAYASGQTGPSGQIEAALGTVNARLGRLRAAERFLEIAVDKAPASVEAWNNLGVVALSMQDLATARNAFQTAFALSSGSNEVARANLARIEELQGDVVPVSDDAQTDLTLVRHGSGRYLLGEGEAE